MKNYLCLDQQVLNLTPLNPTPATYHNPVLLFLGLFENTKENLKNIKDFSHLANP